MDTPGQFGISGEDEDSFEAQYGSMRVILLHSYDIISDHLAQASADHHRYVHEEEEIKRRSNIPYLNLSPNDNVSDRSNPVRTSTDRVSENHT